MNRALLHRIQRLVATTASALVLTVACSREPPPHSVIDFLDNPRLLEATMVRCAANRTELKYTPECMNAREAVDRLAAADESDRRKELEAQSTRKREALRRAQQAAAEARARAAEAERQRRESEYLLQFEETPPPPGGAVAEQPPASAPPPATVPPPSNAPAYDVSTVSETPAGPPVAEEPRPAGVQTYPQEPVALPPTSELDSVREELRRRAQSDDERQQGGQ